MFIKKIFILIISGILFFIPYVNASSTYSEHAKTIYIYATKLNTAGIKRLIKTYGIDTLDSNDNTALCYAIQNNDIKTYKALIKMGAKSHQYCFNKISENKRISFNNAMTEYEASAVGKYNEHGTLLTRTKIAETEEVSSSTKFGIGLGTIALVGGGVAAIAGGGGGGGSSSTSSSDVNTEISCQEQGGTLINGSCIFIDKPGASPLNDTIQKYHTKEYNSSKSFLHQIKADYAYARGYTGYVIERDKDGYLVDNGSGYISDKKVRVGVLDNGFDIYHPDLIDNIVTNEDGNPYGYNFDYGPCRGGDKTNCYTFNPLNDGSGLGRISLYDANQVLISHTDAIYTQETYNTTFEQYPEDYDWDDLQYNPIPYLSDDEVDKFNTQTNDHGTHVMGIIGATANDFGIQGVAPNVEMIGINYTQTIYRQGEDVFTKAGETFVNNGARVVNMSFGIKLSEESSEKALASYLVNKDFNNLNDSNLENTENLFKYLADNNIVTVKSAGNNGNSFEADTISGVPLSNTFKLGSDYDMTNLFITVVSVNSKNKITSYSQICGVTKNYCLAAPGGDSLENNMIYSTVQNDKNHQKDDSGFAYGYMQGTSMATPVVTGSVALLMGAYPHLTSQQIVEILFTTATDLGTKGVDEVYGHGLINLDAATSPIGYLSFDFLDNNKQNTYSASALNLSKSVNAKILSILPAKFTVFDEYDRGFEIETSSLFADTSKQRRHLFENDFKAFMSHGKKTVKTGNNVSFAFNSSVSGNDIYSPYGFIGVDYNFSNKFGVQAFYSENTILNRGEIFTRTEQNPFISMDNAFGLGFNYKSDKTSFKLDYTGGKNNFFEDEENSDLYDNHMNAITSELSYNLTDNFSVSSILGNLSEKSSVLGMIGNDTFDIGNSNTYFTGMKVTFKPTDRLSLSGVYYRGYTNTSANNNVFSMSDIESESIALNATYKLTSKNNIGLDVYSPLRIVKGSADIVLASGRHQTENKIYLNKYHTSLKDTDREWDVSMFYNKQIKDDANFKTRFGVRFNPEHDANAKPDYFGMFNLNFAF